MGERTTSLKVSSEIYKETNFRSWKSQDGSKSRVMIEWVITQSNDIILILYRFSLFSLC